MPGDKTATMAEAVGSIEPGSSVATGLALEHAIPFAAGHEIVRQGIGGLTLVGPISDMLFDQIVGAGLVDRIRAAWIGNVSAGTAHGFRRAYEAGEVAVENHSNFSIALALQAGAMGAPYFPTRSLLGSDILAEGPFRVAEDPFTGDRVALVPPIRPDWAIVHVQRADAQGNAHFWGNTGILEPAMGAARRVLVVAEEVVDTSVIRSDPSRVLVTREKVAHVVECPGGAHPSPLAGCYDRDHAMFLDYHEATRTPEGYEAWATRWIHGVADRAAYLEQLGRDIFLRDPVPAAGVAYGG